MLSCRSHFDLGIPDPGEMPGLFGDVVCQAGEHLGLRLPNWQESLRQVLET